MSDGYAGTGYSGADQDPDYTDASYVVGGTDDQQASDPTRPVLQYSSPIMYALGMVGLDNYGYSQTQAPIAPPWVEPTFFENENGGMTRATRAPETYYQGQDPTNPSMPSLTDLNDDMVFMGKYTTDNVQQPHIGIPGEEPSSELAPERQADAITVQAALNLPFSWSAEHTIAVQEKMRAAGMKVNDFNSMMSGWSMLVQRASRMFTLSNGKNEVTPWDVLGLVKKESKAAGLLDKHGNVKIAHQTSKSVTDISEGDAWAMLHDQMQQYLGRDPSDQEVRDFASQLNAMAAKDPQITKTTTKMDGETGRVRNSSSVTHQGFDTNDAQHEIYDNLTSTDEYAQVQSATTYFNALLSAIGETAGG